MNKRGFTLVEIILVLAIMIILSIVGLVSLVSRKTIIDLNDTTKQIGALLRQAQSDSMANSQGVAWGVHFANATNTAPFYALFITSYSTSTTKGYYRLPSGISYVTSTLASGVTKDIIFTQISGIPAATATIGLYVPGQASRSSTISVTSVGSVTF